MSIADRTSTLGAHRVRVFATDGSAKEPPSVIRQYLFSRALTRRKADAYYFGDLDYYNLSNGRDVFIVATSPPYRAHP